MDFDVFWVDEDLIQRGLPVHVLSGEPHPLLLLPFARNSLCDDYVFAIRCTSGNRRIPVGDPPQTPILSFEKTLSLDVPEGPAGTIAMFHNLFPVRREVLTQPAGRGLWNRDDIQEAERFLAGMLWDEPTARGILDRTARRKLEDIPRQVRDAAPGDIVEIDGALGVVVSNVVFNRRHSLGSLAIVPLVDKAAIPDGRPAVCEALVPIPEFLKVCQPFERIHQVRLTGRRVIGEHLEGINARVRALLAWETPTPRGTGAGEGDANAVTEPQHRCLFSTRTRPAEGPPPRLIPVRGDRRFAGGNEPFEPLLLDSVRYEGTEGSLRAELWDREGLVSLQLVLEEGRIRLINQVAVLMRHRSSVALHGPAWPSDWVYSVPIGSLSDIRDESIDVSIRAPGISAEYAFRLARPDESTEGRST